MREKTGDHMQFSFLKSRLKKTIERGLAKGKLDDELKELGDITVKSRADAEAICWGLEQLENYERELMREHTRALAGLFQEVDGRECEAFEILQERGIPDLLRLFDKMNKAPTDEEADALLFVLKIFAMYGTVQGTLKIIEAVRQPLKPDGYLWHVILRNFTAGHPEKELLFGSLSDPLPAEFIAVSLLNSANTILIEGGSIPHPFDSAPGRERLRGWLTSSDPEQFSYAHSATAALPFIRDPEEDSLLNLAMKHSDADVRMEAAWAAAKMGREEGIRQLAVQCRDFKTAEAAKQYLSELGREDVIPPETNNPDFAALAEFARWLAHPNELGEAPDKLEIVDHRELPWPPERELKPFWLIKYTLRDKTGRAADSEECGLVGGITFCLFSYKLAQRPPEDAYAVHCCWEMENKNLIERSDVKKESGDYDHLIREWPGAPLENPRMLFVAELSPELKQSQRLVGLASARLKGEQGWVVLDGPRSEWYPLADQPGNIDSVYDGVILQIHIGRYLLGLTQQPDRKKYFAPPKPARAPEQIIEAYQNLLAECQKASGKKRKRAFRTYGVLSNHFEKYIDALIQTGRISEVGKFVREMAPHWDGVSGSGMLGIAAFKAAQWDLAEEFFRKYRNQCTNYERGEEMDFLAELWCRNGKPDFARELLVECLRRLLEESKTATGSDEDLFEKWFQKRREAFLKILSQPKAESNSWERWTSPPRRAPPNVVAPA